MPPVLRLRLKELREQQDLTQAELAELVQVTQVTISHLESGKTRSVNLDLLDRLARALKVRASELGVLLKRE